MKHSFLKYILLVDLLLVHGRELRSQTNFWKQTSGPGGGSGLTLVINSNGHLFVGTDGGGVFGSTDNGSNWIGVNTGLMNTDLLCLAINSSGHLFAGTWGGVFRSTDNGANWTVLTPRFDI